MQRFAYLQSQTPAAAAAALAENANALLKAGGVDVLDLLKERIVSPTLIVDISQLPELRTVTVDAEDGTLRIGTLTTFAQIATVGANKTTYTDGGNAQGTYYYRVRAYNGAGDSTYSNTVVVQVQ